MLFAALLILAAVGAGSGTPAPPDGTYTYAIQKGNDAIGSSNVTVKRSDAGITVHESETFTDSSLSFVADETLDPATLQPKSYAATYTKAGGSQTVRMAFNRSGASATFEGIGTSALPLPRGTKFGYVVELALMSGFGMLPAQIHQSNLIEFSTYIPSKMTIVSNRVITNAGSARPAGVPAADVSLSINGLADYDEWYDPGTFVVHAVSVPAQSVTIKLTKSEFTK